MNPNDLFTLEEYEFILKNFIRGTNIIADALVNLQETGQPFAGPANTSSNALDDSVQGTVDDIVLFLKDRFTDFNEEEVRNGLRDFLNRRLQELG